MKKALIVTGGWEGHEPYKAGQIFNEFWPTFSIFQYNLLVRIFIFK